MVQFSSGLGPFKPNPDLDYQVQSRGLANLNPKPLKPGSIGLGLGLNLNSIKNIYIMKW